MAKWAAVQEYRHGHFVGVNSEHPMLPKMLAWASLTTGERWGRVAATHGWPSLNPEGWLRMPNVLFGAATTAILFLFCRRMMGVAGSFAASLFWAVAPLPVALNRLTKEETPLTFFTLLACYFYCRAQQAVCGQECAAMVRPERNRLWPWSCLPVHSSPSWLECTCLVSCRKNGADSQAVSIQLQTVFPRDVPYLCCGQPGHSLSGQLQCHRALAPS